MDSELKILCPGLFRRISNPAEHTLTPFDVGKPKLFYIFIV
jgi:hypothetical protein